ncbi:isoprenyl transferase [Candidatus Nucleicultrix amoebiphila]
MDGNGRWAKARGMPRMMGHRKGVEVAKEITRAAADIGIEYLTIWAFSTENWRRPPEEISGLMGLLHHTLKADLTEFHENGVRLRVLGSRKNLDQKTLELIDHAVKLTQNNTRFNLNIAFNYGGRDDIIQAARTLAKKVQEGALQPDEINEDLFSESLYTCGIPDPELLIRTSNELRISNYILWQMAYTEMVFIETYWPDFTKDDLLKAIIDYQQRDRRFGKVSSK